MRALRMALCLVFLSALLGGCAGTGRQTEELLQKDFHALSNPELLTYYYQLNDQIARVERRTTGTSVGFGIGSDSVRVGASQGVGRGVIAEDLRTRRNEVRTELTLRGLRP